MTATTATPDPYFTERTRLLRRVRISGVTRADIARRMGYEEESGFVYVRSVLNGGDISSPMLVRIEAALNEILEERGIEVEA